MRRVCALALLCFMSTATVAAARSQHPSGSRDAVPARALAVRVTSAATGTVDSLSVFIAAGGGADTALAGLYSDRSGAPARLLTSGTAALAASAGWVTIHVRPVSLSSGVAYWIAVLTKPVALRAAGHRSCESASAAAVASAGLPAQWRSGHRSTGCLAATLARPLPDSPAPTGAPSPGHAPPASHGAAPADLARPAISGTPQQGQTLTASNGSWSGEPSSYLYQWQDCAGSSCSDIAGADSASYRVGAADDGSQLDVVITATNATGSAVASSARTAPVSPSTVAQAPPTSLAPPAITGIARQGQTLAASGGSWSGDPTSYSYQWQDCSASSCSDIPGATGSSYALAASTVGQSIVVHVTATNAGGSTSATSAAVGPVASDAGTSAGTGASLAQCAGTCTAPSFTAPYVNVSAPGSSCTGNGGGADQCPIKIFVPANLVTNNPAAPVPLVLDFPDGTGVSQGTGMGDWINYSPTGRFIVAEVCISTTSCVPDDTEVRGGAPTPSDVGEAAELNAVVAYMESHYAIDASRIFAVGGSKGGNAAFEAACNPSAEPLFAGISVYSAAPGYGASPSAAPFGAGACRAMLSRGTTTPVANPHPIMFQYVESPQDGATRINCYWTGAPPCLPTGPPSGSWFYPPITTSYGPGFLNTIWANAEGCAATPVTATYDPVSGGSGQLTSSTFGGCTLLASGGAAEVQGIQYTVSNGLASCHWASCTQALGNFSYNIATATWAFWTTGTTTPQ